jgi:hypothetical protein
MWIWIADHGATCDEGDTALQIGPRLACVKYLDERQSAYFLQQAVETIDAQIAVARPSRNCTTLVDPDAISGKIAVIDDATCVLNVTRLLPALANARAVVLIMPDTLMPTIRNVVSDFAPFPSTDGFDFSNMNGIPVFVASSAHDGAILREGVGDQASLSIG